MVRLFKAALLTAVVGFSSNADAQVFQLTVRPDEDGLDRKLEASSLSKAAIENEDSQPQDILAAAQSDYAAIVSALYANGFFSGTVNVRVNGREAADISPFEPPARVDTVSILVDPGPQFVFGDLSITPLATDTTIANAFSRGEPAQTSVIRQAARSAVRGWQDLGYPRAEVSGQEITADHRNRSIDVALQVDPGQQLRFGDLAVQGNKRVTTRKVAELTGLPKGELVTPEEIRDAERRLSKSGAFRSFVVRPADEPNTDGTLDFTAEVLEEKPRRLGFGAEYNSSDGIRLTAFWFHRNLTGQADRLRFSADITRRLNDRNELEFLIGTSYRRPAVISSEDDFIADAQFYQEDLEDYIETGLVFSGRLERQFSDEFSASVGGLLSRVITDFGPEKRTFDIFGVPTVLTWDSRDIENDATRGIFAKGEILPFLGSNDAKNGIRTTLDARFYQRIDKEARLVLAARGLLGSVFGAGRGEVPERFLFYSGGSETVRGQEYRSLGVDVGGATLGGAGFAGASFEARYGITDTIEAVGFYDYGYVSEGSLGTEGGRSHSGAGLGVRYVTPIGPIRFDVGAPVSGGGSGVQFYLGIGQAF